MARIPQSFINDLLSRVDIVDVIGSRIPLKKAGKEYVACCPFHHEKTPSFSVSQQKQFYFCFGCGAHGNSLDFLIEHERLNFVEAVEALAHHAGVSVPREQSSQPQANHDPLFLTLERCASFYKWSLKQSPKAIDYLKSRGITGKTALSFGLGYAPEGYHTLQGVLEPSDDLIANLKQTGMLGENDEGQSYDRFRDRIMFPIRNHRGRIIAFGGRVLNHDKPKYLNSPETPIFHKGLGLYGLYEARQAMGGTLEQLIVVEGYMDVVMLAQHGIHHAVATLGTAINREQVSLMYRNVNQIIFCFDGDEAGRRAAWKALESTLPQLDDGLDARFAFLPEGEDPDSLVQRIGHEGFLAMIHKDSLSFDDFTIQELSKNIDPDGGIASRAKFNALALPLIQSMRECTLKTLFSNKISSYIGLEHVSNDEEKTSPSSLDNRVLNRHQIKETLEKQNILRKVMVYLMHFPHLASMTVNNPAWKDSPIQGYPLLHGLITKLRENPMPIGVLLENYRHDESTFKTLTALAGFPPPDDIRDDEAMESLWADMQSYLGLTYTREKLNVLISQPFEKLSQEERRELLKFSISTYPTP